MVPALRGRALRQSIAGERCVLCYRRRCGPRAVPIMHESQIDEAVVDNDDKRLRQTYLPLAGFALVCALPLLLDWNSTRALGLLALNNDTYSHIPLIPLVTLFLIYMDRRSIFSCPSYGWRTATAFLFPGIA